MIVRKRCFFALIFVALMLAVTTISAAAQSQAKRRIAYVSPQDCAYRDLCDALVRQAQKVLDEGGDLCTVPYEHAYRGMRLPDWQPVDPRSRPELLRRALPNIGWQTSRIEKRIKAEMPDASWERVREVFWQRYGARLIEAIEAGRGTLETARLDFDNTGLEERVYRVTRLEPVDKTNPDGPWRARRCSLPRFEPPVPYYAVFLSDEDEVRIGSAPLTRVLASRDLFIYRGRTYAVSRSPAGLAANWIRSSSRSGEAYLSPAAEVLTNKYAPK